MSVVPTQDPARRGRNYKQDQLPKFDQEMREAKNKGTVLMVYLPCPTAFTDEEDNSFAATVVVVDRFAIKFAIVGTKICVWVPKQDVIIQDGVR